uniref:Uncharacterized protein n=1 Tax=Kalanchoe fedtschenkoi TaxID=63787 RepID=A0A7N0U6S2_KALFE
MKFLVVTELRCLRLIIIYSWEDMPATWIQVVAANRQPYAILVLWIVIENYYQSPLKKIIMKANVPLFQKRRFYGVVVSTLDFESSDLGSTPGRTFIFSSHYLKALF